MFWSPAVFKVPLWFVVTFLVLAITAGLFLFLYFLIRGRKVKRIGTSRIYFSFLECMLLPIFWCVGQLYEVFFGKQQTGPIYFLEYFAVCFGAFAWLFFCLEYVDNKKLMKRKNMILFSLLPIFFYICVLTNDYHHLFLYYVDGARKYGPLFMMQFIEFISYTFLGVIFLVRYSFKKMRGAKTLSYMLILSFFIPVIFLSLKVSGTVKFDIVATGFIRKDFDLSSPSFFITMIIFAISFFKYRLMNLTPLALKQIFSNINEACAAIDEENSIIILNTSFRKYFPGFLLLQNHESALNFARYLEEKIDPATRYHSILYGIRNPIKHEIIEEMCMIEKVKKHYTVAIRPMFHNDEYVGKIISFSDITDYKHLLENSNQKNEEFKQLNEDLSLINNNLIAANKKIKEYAEEIRTLSIMKERNRFARDVHDTLGHSMTILITLLEASHLSVYDDASKTDQIIVKAISTARTGLNEIRKSIKNLVDEENYEKSFLEQLEDLIMEFEITGIQIDFSVDEEIEFLEKNISEVIFRICEESLTNAVKHGNAAKISFVLKVHDCHVLLYIFDNGIGCTDIKQGMGLRGMNQRVKELNGNLTYSSCEDLGFNISVDIPIFTSTKDAE